MISRHALLGLSLAGAGMVSGCTGTGVFLDHTFKWFDENPNSPAGSSETFQQIRGNTVDVPPLLPEPDNVWPENQGPDQTLEDLEKQQAEQIKRGANPQGNRTNGAAPGQPPVAVQPGAPPPNLQAPTQRTPNGPAVNTNGGKPTQGYRGLGSGSPTSSTPGGGSVLVPNGNGTSTLIGPDGSVQTVPTKP